jgi:hypothetical protein
MKNIRTVQFVSCRVGVEHWSAIVALPLLEDLAFHDCSFLRFPRDTEREKNLKISRLSVVGCLRQYSLIAAVDKQYLRSFRTDYHTLWGSSVDWLRHSAVTELYVDIISENVFLGDGEDPRLNIILSTTPRSLAMSPFRRIGSSRNGSRFLADYVGSFHCVDELSFLSLAHVASGQ